MISAERRRLVAALLIAIIVSGSRDAWAQTRSAMTGTVRDAAGATLRGVTVTLENAGGSIAPHTTVTNERGVYRLPDLPPAVYALTATGPGLQTVKRTEVRIAVGTTVTMDLTLGSSATPDTVVMRGAGPVVNVTTAAATTNVDQEDRKSVV